jgi:hypothetical protein
MHEFSIIDIDCIKIIFIDIDLIYWSHSTNLILYMYSKILWVHVHLSVVFRRVKNLEAECTLHKIINIFFIIILLRLR